MILNRFEERLRLSMVRVPALRRVRLTWPVHLRVRPVPLSKHLPVLRIPGIVERFHPLQVLFSTHASPHDATDEKDARPHPPGDDAFARRPWTVRHHHRVGWIQPECECRRTV